MGLYNYDYFLEEEVPKVTQIIALGPEVNKADLKLVFADRRVVISPTELTGKKASFKNIPKDEKVYAVAIQFDAQGSLELAINSLTTSKDPVSLDFEPVADMNTLKNRLESINWR